MKTRIRKMTFEDLPRITEIEEEIFSVPWSKQMFEQEIKNHYAFVITNEENNDLIGYVCGWIVLDEFTITNIGIAKALQKKGYGRSLVRFIISALIKEKCFKFFLEVRSSNILAIRLYETFGFKSAGIRKNYYQHPPEDAIMMKLDFFSLLEKDKKQKDQEQCFHYTSIDNKVIKGKISC